VIEELVLGYGSRAEVVEDVVKAMEQIQGDMPRSWQLVKDALRANGGQNNREILALVDKYMGALRDPKHWAEVMADVWELAGKMPNPDFRKALLQLAESRLGAPLKVPNQLFKGGAFFKDYAKTGRPLIDTYFEGKAHGDLSHLLQDLVLDKAFGAGTSSKFRQLLGRAEGKVTVWEQAAQVQHRQAHPVRSAQPLGNEHHVPRRRDRDAHRRLRLALDVRPALREGGDAAAAPARDHKPEARLAVRLQPARLRAPLVTTRGLGTLGCAPRA
jgi:hypothetical protein